MEGRFSIFRGKLNSTWNFLIKEYVDEFTLRSSVFSLGMLENQISYLEKVLKFVSIKIRSYISDQKILCVAAL